MITTKKKHSRQAKITKHKYISLKQLQITREQNKKGTEDLQNKADK